MTRELDPSRLQKLPTEQLISLIVQQQQIIEQLQQEVERLKASLKLDSQTSQDLRNCHRLSPTRIRQGSSLVLDV
jgi:hypothetical protein